MNKLILNNSIININQPLLTIKELLNTINYEYNDTFLDKFWQNIKDDSWIYIDDNMLKYIGYSRSEYKKNKQDYLNLLKENFEIDIDFKILFLKEFEEFSKCQKLALENSIINDHNKVKHLIVSPDCFKQSLMLLKTNKSKEIKKYYIELERIFKFYLDYQNQYKNQELENKDNIIEQLENYSIKNQNNLYIEKFSNKKCIYLFKIIDLISKDEYIKIGSTKDIAQRYLTLKQKFKKLNILNVFDCSNNNIEIEQDILNDDYIKNNLYKDLINGNKSIEIVKLTETCTYDSIISIVKKYINNLYSLNPIQILENKKIDIDAEKINLINRLLDNGYNPTDIVNKLFNNEINVNTINNNQDNHTNISNNERTNSETRKIQYIKPTKKPNSKVIYKVNPDTLEIIKKYDTLTMLLIEEKNIGVKQKAIYKAIRYNIVYQNYRWVYEGTEIKPNHIPIYNKKIKTNNVSHIDTIIKLNNTKTEIIDTYASLKQLATLEKMSVNTIKKYISNNMIYKNYSYIYLKDCSQILIDNYLSNGNIINKYKANHSKIIIKYDPINNVEFKYESLSDALLQNHIRYTKLKHAIENDILVDGFKWKYG